MGERRQCAGPGCFNMIEQVESGRGHRERLYCHKNCRMAAVRLRQREAEAEAERQRLAELERMEKQEIQNRFPKLAKESIELLYQLKKRDLYLVSTVGIALNREREQGERAAPTVQSRDLLEANIISWGHLLGFQAICEQGVDIPAGLSGWWHYCNHTPAPVLGLFHGIVQQLVLEKKTTTKATA